MELDIIRTQLDTLDRSLKYLVLLRTSLATLVGKVKAEKGLPIYQADRERAIYDSLKDFCEHTGVSLDLLTRIYKDLIAESVRVEENLMQRPPVLSPECLEEAACSLDHSMQALRGFIAQMDSVTDYLNTQNVGGNDFFEAISESNKNYLESME